MAKGGKEKMIPQIIVPSIQRAKYQISIHHTATLGLFQTTTANPKILYLSLSTCFFCFCFHLTGPINSPILLLLYYYELLSLSLGNIPLDAINVVRQPEVTFLAAVAALPYQEGTSMYPLRRI